MCKKLLTLSCLCLILSGCSEGNSTLYGSNVTVAGNLSGIAYIKDYDVMDCCEEYNSIFFELIRTKASGLFEIYDLEFYSDTGTEVTDTSPINVEWKVCDAIRSLSNSEVSLYLFRDNLLIPATMDYADGVAKFTANSDDLFVVVCPSNLYNLPRCAVTECDGNCKSCS